MRCDAMRDEARRGEARRDEVRDRRLDPPSREQASERPPLVDAVVAIVNGDPSLPRVARVARVGDKLRFSAVRLGRRVRTELMRARAREGEKVGGGGRG